MERVVAPLCNPSAGGGRVLRELEAALRELDVCVHTAMTRSPERVRELHVSASRSFAVDAEGDPIGRTPTTIRVIHRTVRVLAPR